MPLESGRRPRRWRTRPSMGRVSIVAGDVDFLQHRDSSWIQTPERKNDPSFRVISEHISEEDEEEKLQQQPIKKPAAKKGRRARKQKAKPKPKEPSLDKSEVRKLNAIFEEADDYSLIIEKVYDDRYVMPGEASIHSRYSKAAGQHPLQPIDNTADSSSWSLDQSTHEHPQPKIEAKSPSPKHSFTIDAAAITAIPKEEFSSFAESPAPSAKDATTSQLDLFLSPDNVVVRRRKHHSFDRSECCSAGPSTSVEEKNASAVFSTPEASIIEAKEQDHDDATPNENRSVKSLSLSFDQKEFIASTPAPAGKQAVDESAAFNAFTPQNNMVVRTKIAHHSMHAASISRFSAADGYGNKNASQVIDNPLNLFYYLRGFSGVPTDLNYLLHACDQPKVQTWDEFLPERSCKKLGEGAYGEVFQSTINGVQVALKVLPFMDKQCYHEGLVNGDRMKHSMEILPELLITKELSQLANEGVELDVVGYSTPGFVRLIQAAIVQGEYPDTLLTEWDKFDKLKRSENDRPDTYSSPNQLFMVFALSLGGKDLEAYAREAFSIFFQVALSLAIGEETLEFEHRDLHIGNVLIAQCRSTETIKFLFNNEVIHVKSCGALVSIIDFTNSRMQKEGTTIFLDLSTDEELFKGSGDYQFDIYRMMRERNRDEWREFCPITNVFWLHYLATKLFGAKKIPPKRRREIMSKLDTLLEYDRIKTFLEAEPILEIFQNFVVS